MGLVLKRFIFGYVGFFNMLLGWQRMKSIRDVLRNIHVPCIAAFPIRVGQVAMIDAWTTYWFARDKIRSIRGECLKFMPSCDYTTPVVYMQVDFQLEVIQRKKMLKFISNTYRNFEIGMWLHRETDSRSGGSVAVEPCFGGDNHDELDAFADWLEPRLMSGTLDANLDIYDLLSDSAKEKILRFFHATPSDPRNTYGWVKVVVWNDAFSVRGGGIQLHILRPTASGILGYRLEIGANTMGGDAYRAIRSLSIPPNHLATINPEPFENLLDVIEL